MRRWILPLAALLVIVYSGESRATMHGRLLPTDTAEAVLSGFVNDSASGETIIGATIRVRALHLGAITNKSGFFSLHVPAEIPLGVEISSLGFKTRNIRATLKPGEERSEHFVLAEQSVSGGEVTVQSTEEEREREEPQVSRITLTPQQMINLPKMGQSDLFRVLQFLPGVQTSSEIFERPLCARRLAG